MNQLQRYLIACDAEDCGGSQTFFVDAASVADALRRFKKNGGDLYSNDSEITSIGEPELVGTTGIDDFGDSVVEAGLDLRAHLQRMAIWSEKTFGPGERTQAVLAHIRKELVEIEETPTDTVEWIDVVIMALDGARRAGATPDDIIAAIVSKQAINEQRQWPDWRTAKAGEPIEHLREGEGHAPAR